MATLLYKYLKAYHHTSVNTKLKDIISSNPGLLTNETIFNLLNNECKIQIAQVQEEIKSLILSSLQGSQTEITRQNYSSKGSFLIISSIPIFSGKKLEATVLEILNKKKIRAASKILNAQDRVFYIPSFLFQESIVSFQEPEIDPTPKQPKTIYNQSAAQLERLKNAFERYICETEADNQPENNNSDTSEKQQINGESFNNRVPEFEDIPEIPQNSKWNPAKLNKNV